MPAPPKKSYLNWVPGPVLGYGPPRPTMLELVEDQKAIHIELKRSQKRKTVRVKSHLP